LFVCTASAVERVSRVDASKRPALGRNPEWLLADPPSALPEADIPIQAVPAIEIFADQSVASEERNTMARDYWETLQSYSAVTICLTLIIGQ
jgi:hypothetical protein